MAYTVVVEVSVSVPTLEAETVYTEVFGRLAQEGKMWAFTAAAGKVA